MENDLDEPNAGHRFLKIIGTFHGACLHPARGTPDPNRMFLQNSYDTHTSLPLFLRDRVSAIPLRS
jgi:hypothetical protein